MCDQNQPKLIGPGTAGFWGSAGAWAALRCSCSWYIHSARASSLRPPIAWTAKHLRRRRRRGFKGKDLHRRQSSGSLQCLNDTTDFEGQKFTFEICCVGIMIPPANSVGRSGPNFMEVPKKGWGVRSHRRLHGRGKHSMSMTQGRGGRQIYYKNQLSLWVWSTKGIPTGIVVF